MTYLLAALRAAGATFCIFHCPPLRGGREET